MDLLALSDFVLKKVCLNLSFKDKVSLMRTCKSMYQRRNQCFLPLMPTDRVDLVNQKVYTVQRCLELAKSANVSENLLAKKSARKTHKLCLRNQVEKVTISPYGRLFVVHYNNKNGADLYRFDPWSNPLSQPGAKLLWSAPSLHQWEAHFSHDERHVFVRALDLGMVYLLRINRESVVPNFGYDEDNFNAMPPHLEWINTPFATPKGFVWPFLPEAEPGVSEPQDHLIPMMRFYEQHHTGALMGETLSTSSVPQDLDEYPTSTTGQKIFMAFVKVSDTERLSPSPKKQKRIAFAVPPTDMTLRGHAELLMVRPYIDPDQNDGNEEHISFCVEFANHERIELNGAHHEATGFNMITAVKLFDDLLVIINAFCHVTVVNIKHRTRVYSAKHTMFSPVHDFNSSFLIAVEPHMKSRHDPEECQPGKYLLEKQALLQPLAVKHPYFNLTCYNHGVLLTDCDQSQCTFRNLKSCKHAGSECFGPNYYKDELVVTALSDKMLITVNKHNVLLIADLCQDPKSRHEQTRRELSGGDKMLVYDVENYISYYF